MTKQSRALRSSPFQSTASQSRAFFLTLLAPSILMVIGCGSDPEPEPDATPADPVGTFSASWSVTDGTAAIDCSAVGADNVRITAIEINAALGNVIGFTCEEGSGTSRELPAGTYRLDFDLRTGDGRSLLTSPIRVEDVVIDDGGDATVEAQTFSVLPLGELNFTTAVAGIASNCDDEGAGGAGIVGFRFNLRDQAMNCVPSIFEILPGGQPGGAFPSMCDPEATPFACIEPDQAISISPEASSGPRTLEILAINGDGLACRRHLAQFEQPGNNLVLDLGELGLLDNTAEPGCVAP